MKQKEFEENILGYLEGSLAPELRAEFEQAAENNSSLKQLLREYQELVALEAELAALHYQPAPSFKVKVMDRVSKVQIGVLKQLFSHLKRKQRMLLPAVASVVTACLLFTLHRGYSPGAWEELSVITLPESRQESPEEGAAKNPESKTERLPETPTSSIPSGYSLVTIPLEQASTVDGSLQPGMRADVIFTYSSEGKQRSATVSRFTQVVSVTEGEIGEKQEANARSATLLVTAKEAAKIKMAQNSGKVSLAAVGDEDSRQEASRDSLTIDDLIGRPARNDSANVAAEGVMFAPDPKSGRQLRYVLRRGRWEIDEGYSSSAPAPTELPPIQQKKRLPRVSNGENNRVQTSLQPRSAFEVNLSSESYLQARKRLQMGSLPAPDTVVAEEFVNYFDYQYPDVQERPFLLAYEIAPAPFDPGRYLIKLTVKSRTRSALDSSMNANMDLSARDLALQVEFNPAVVAEYRLFGYDAPTLSQLQLNNVTTDSGEIGFGQVVIAIYEVAFVDAPQGQVGPKHFPKEGAFATAEDKIGLLTIRFTTPDSRHPKSMELPLSKSEVKSSLAAASDDFRFAIAVVHFAQILAKSKFAFSYSLDEITELAKGAKGPDVKRKRQEFIDLLTTASALLE